MYLRERSSGFTLIELIITMAVAAILMLLVVPSFQRMVEDNQVTSETNTLIQALQMARSEAVKRFASVSVTADGGDFANGWCIHTDVNCAGNEIRQYDARDSDYTSAVPAVVFDNRGEAGAMTQIRVAPEDCPAGEADRVRRITVAISGQIRLVREDCP